MSDFYSDELYEGDEHQKRELAEIRLKEIDREIEYFMDQKSTLDLFPLMENSEYEIYQKKKNNINRIFSSLITLNLLLIPCVAGIFFLLFHGYPGDLLRHIMFTLIVSLCFLSLFRAISALFFSEIPPENVIDEIKRNDELTRLDYIDTRIQSLKDEREQLKK